MRLPYVLRTPAQLFDVAERLGGNNIPGRVTDSVISMAGSLTLLAMSSEALDVHDALSHTFGGGSIALAGLSLARYSMACIEARRTVLRR